MNVRQLKRGVYAIVGIQREGHNLLTFYETEFHSNLQYLYYQGRILEKNIIEQGAFYTYICLVRVCSAWM